MGEAALSHVFLHVASLAVTRSFYVDLIGLVVLADEPGYLRLGGGGGFRLGIEERGPEEIGSAGMQLVIRVTDVDTTAALLRSAGVDVRDPADQEWGARHAWLHDPDRYPVSIFTMREDR